jgi:hypothetical protein
MRQVKLGETHIAFPAGTETLCGAPVLISPATWPMKLASITCEKCRERYEIDNLEDE